MDHIRFLSLICILSAAAAMDIKTFRVKNLLIISGFTFGMVLNLLKPDLTCFMASAAGMLGPIVFMVLYKYSMLGAADIKLFSMTGFYLGFFYGIYAIVLTFLIAVPIALYRLCVKRSLKKRLFHFYCFLKNFSGHENHVYMDFSDKDNSACIHMTVPLLMAVVILYVKFLIK